MFDVMLDLLLPTGTAHLAMLILLLIFVMWHRYSLRRRDFVAHQKQKDANGVPWTFPCIFPPLGSLPITYLWNPRAFVLDKENFFQCTHPILVRILHLEFFVLGGPDNIKALFKNSGACTSIPFVKFALQYAFGLPAKASSLYDKDDSGDDHAPRPDSTVEVRNRIGYRVHRSLLTFMEGKGLLPFWRRFEDNITQQLYSLYDRLDEGWEEHADLMKFVRDETTATILDALCGPYLLKLNPNFLQDYWNFDRNLQTYLQGMPWLLAPKAYAVRERALDAIKTWQKHARDHFSDSAIDSDGDDPFWGSSFFRERHDMFLEMDGFDYDAIASEDFGAIWAVRNSISAASWAIFDIFRDPDLLASLRAEIDPCVRRDGFDIDKLLHLPLLQAVYAETLRLRMHFYIIRTSDRVQLNIRNWVIPKRRVIVTPTTVAHMDASSWNTGLGNEHPLDQFWAGRFLTYEAKSINSNSQLRDVSTSSPVFSTEGLEGSWIPYGGGTRQCPGRHFAKRQILLTIALMVHFFDCEILGSGKDLKEDFTLKGFGSGVSHPASKVPMRIRRRGRGVA